MPFLSKNVGVLDRALRICAGVLLIALAANAGVVGRGLRLLAVPFILAHRSRGQREGQLLFRCVNTAIDTPGTAAPVS